MTISRHAHYGAKLFEVLIEGKSNGNAQALYDNFACAIGERPTLVLELYENILSVEKIVRSDAYDLADMLFDESFSRSNCQRVTFTDFQEGEELVKDVIGAQ